MLAPQIPDPQLEGLVEIALPQHVSYRPETAAWFVLLGLLALIAARFAYRRYRRSRANRYRRWALDKLEVIEGVLEQNLGWEKPMRELPILVKQTALHAYPRPEVASLTGDDWLRFLDASYGGTGFTDGPGQILVQTAFLPARTLERTKQEDVRQLMLLVRLWINKHRSEV